MARVRDTAARVDGELRSRGVDPAHVLLGVALLHAWRFMRRVARLERDAAAMAARVEKLEAAAHMLREAGEDAKKAEENAAAAWGDLSKGIKLPW